MHHLRSASVLLLSALLPCCSLEDNVGSIGPAAVEARTIEVRTTDADAAAAAYQARSNAKAGAVSHGDFEARMDRFGIQGESAENLASGAETVEEVIVDWQESPGHNANLLLPSMTRIGLARVDTPNDRNGPYWALVLAE